MEHAELRIDLFEPAWPTIPRGAHNSGRDTEYHAKRTNLDIEGSLCCKDQCCAIQTYAVHRRTDAQEKLDKDARRGATVDARWCAVGTRAPQRLRPNRRLSGRAPTSSRSGTRPASADYGETPPPDPHLTNLRGTLAVLEGAGLTKLGPTTSRATAESSRTLRCAQCQATPNGATCVRDSASR